MRLIHPLKSYRAAVILNFVLVATVPLIVFGIIMAKLATSELESDATLRSLTLVQTLSEEIDAFFDHSETILRQTATVMEHGYYHDPYALQEYLNTVIQAGSPLDSIYILDDTGDIIHAAPESEHLKGFSMAGQPFFKMAGDSGKAFWASPFIDLTTMRMTLPAGMPFHGGMVVGYVNLNLLRSITQRVYIQGRRLAFITDQTGVLIAHPDEQAVVQRINESRLDIVRRGMEGATETLIYEDRGVEYIGSVTQVRKTAWSVIAAQPTAEAFAVSIRMKKLLWIGSGITLALALCLALWNSGRILRPVLSLTEDTRKVAGGDYAFSPSAKHPYSEFNALAHDFSLMTQAIREREQAIRQSEDRIQAYAQSLEVQVRQRTAQLEAANRELESFSYSVSHDLRAPLRGIDGWGLALLEDCADRLDEQGRRHLQRVRSETQRMGKLIDDLLELSRVTRSEMNREQVDLSSLVHTITARLQEVEAGRQVQVIIQPGLMASGDVRLIDVLLSNLLANAWKFTGKQASAIIEFGRTDLDSGSAYFVRDNGVGFDMAYAGKLFGAFQRMHKASEFPGSGVGLATVQRIVRRHGGRVWAESEVGKGATFYFTLEG